MTRDEAREFAKVVQAYADGKQVQVCNADRYWFDLDDPEFFTRTIGSYRIKPEPREWWMVVRGTQSPTWTYPKESDARTQRDGLNAHELEYPYTIIHVREVMP